MPQDSPIKRRIAPSVPLKLDLLDDGGAKLTLNFRLSFDFNALARVEEKTGVTELGFAIWAKLSPRVLGAMLWAGILAHHPEYLTVDDNGKETEEGLEIVRSYIDPGNIDLVHDAIWDAYMATLPSDQAQKLKDWRKRREEELRNKAKAKSPNADAPVPGGALATNEDAQKNELSDGTNSGPSPDTTSASLKASSAG